jgi:hypothetical protein
MQTATPMNLIIETDKLGNSCYFPNLFTMRIDHDYLEQDGYPKKEYFPVFMHEYGHLIQDTTTLFGVFEFARFNDQIVEAVETIRNLGQQNALPLNKNVNKDISTFSFFSKMREVTHPGEKWNLDIDWEFIEFVDSIYVDIIHKGNPVTYEKIQAKFKCKKSGYDFIHAIGVNELKENHSMAIENIYRGTDEYYICNGKSDRDFKYFVIRNILKNVFVNVTNDAVIAICHWSLNSINPGKQFKNIVIFLEKSYS